MANFTDEINGLYAGKTLLTFDTFYNNLNIRKNLETIIVPDVVKLVDARQEYLLKKLSDQGVNLIYISVKNKALNFLIAI